MQYYNVLGGILSSQLEFPELPSAPAQKADWTLLVLDTPPGPGGPRIGKRTIGAEIYQLSEIADGVRLEYSHAGCFDIQLAKSTIVWHRMPDAKLELVRAITLGPGLALLLEANGTLCLHGSAIALGAKGVAFLGGKHHGKSTLALALTSAGGRLISDDLVAITPGAAPTVRPGVPSMRLWGDVVAKLDVTAVGGDLLVGTKSTLRGLANERLADASLPLAAIYLLHPVASNEMAVAASRSRLKGAASVIGLKHQTKLPDSLIGYNAAGRQLPAIATVTETVPVFTLSIARDLARLPAVVEQIFDWHSFTALSSSDTQR